MARCREFVETLVALHCAAEGVMFRGLRPAGTPPDPIVAIAERAVLSGVLSALASVYVPAATAELQRRFAEVVQLKSTSGNELPGLREYTLGLHRFLVWVADGSGRSAFR